MEAKDLLPNPNEIAQASIWADKDGVNRVHQYCIEIENRIAILTALKVIKTIRLKLLNFSLKEEHINFVREIDNIIKEFEKLYIQVVDKEIYFRSDEARRRYL